MRTTVGLDGRSLTPAGVAAIARDGATGHLTAAARARNARARVAVEAHLAAGAPLYGATTGVGPFLRRHVEPEERAAHQLALLRSHAAGGGAWLEPELVRAAMAVRLNQLGAGGAGVGDGLLDALQAALDAGLVPAVRELGSLGTGDITALAEIALALLGEGEVWQRGARVPAADALRAAGLRPPALEGRDAIAFLSSNAVTVASAALAAVGVREALDATLAVAALSFLAADGDRDVLDPRVHAGRPHAGQQEVAERMRALLARELPGAGPAPATVHDPFAFRVQSQVDGAVLDALAALERVVGTEANAAAENAVVADGPGGAALLASGNFHLGAVALALDGLRVALAQSASLVAARCSALLDPAVTGLPAGLAERAVQSGAMILEYPAHAAAADVRWLAAPLAAQTASVAGGIESHACFAGLAAARTREASGRQLDTVAVELVLAVRALRLRGRHPRAGPAGRTFAAAAEVLPDAMDDRPLTGDLAAARRLVAAGAPGSRRVSRGPSRRPPIAVAAS